MYAKGRLKTISSLLDVEAEKKEKKENGNIKLRKHRELIFDSCAEKDEEKYNKIQKLVGHFKERVEGIMRVDKEELWQQERLETLEREENFTEE